MSSQNRTALVLFGSETGNAQDVADEIAKLLERLHFLTQVFEMDSIDVVGLFNWAIRKLYKRLLQLGARDFYPRGESDSQHPEGVDGDFIPWSAGLRAHLLETYDVPAGLSPIPEDVLLTPKWLLDFVNPSLLLQHANRGPYSIPDPQVIPEANLHSNGPEAGKPKDAASDQIQPPDEMLPIPDSIIVTLHRNDRVTPTSHWQDVRWLTFVGPELVEYQPGDVLTVFPKNFPQGVNEIISLMGWTTVADEPICFIATTPSSDRRDENPPIRHLLPAPDLTLRKLLTHHLDISAIPRRSFFSLIAHFTDDPFQKERLLEFTKTEYLDELHDYTTRPRRSILEVLQEFDTVKVPWRWAGNLFPALKGRQFSIASGGSLKTAGAGPSQTRFDLLVAMVKYRTVIRRVRQGVCSRYLASLPIGTQARVLLRRGGLHVSSAQATKPVIMVAPGTGIAPMRSMLWERLSWKQHAENNKQHPRINGHSTPTMIGKHLLFFGCRNKDSDYFFKREWEQLGSDIDLRVFAAFSRDQRAKVYVQDLIREQAELVHHFLHDQLGLIYICGSSGKMPQAVREALIEVFQSRGSLDRASAEAYLLKMEKDGRYQQETW
ncbi:MAG: NAPDH-dependent diflavin reductase [Lichina confinis]|nr:MAG: NAPDH-dependent diflavin reductase [Lichina confinis]